MIITVVLGILLAIAILIVGFILLTNRPHVWPAMRFTIKFVSLLIGTGYVAFSIYLIIGILNGTHEPSAAIFVIGLGLLVGILLLLAWREGRKKQKQVPEKYASGSTDHSS